jgi:hypothetical protein
MKKLIKWIKNEYREFVSARKRIKELEEEVQLLRACNTSKELQNIELFAKLTSIALAYNQYNR